MARLLATLFVALCMGCAGAHGDVASPDTEPGNQSGEALLEELALAVETSDRIVAVEHSYRLDAWDAGNPELPERQYRVVELSDADRSALAAALRSTDPHVSDWVAACIFEPHHRLEFHKAGGATETLEICFGCGQLEWNGTRADEPRAIYATLDTFVRRLGMHPDRDWSALAASAACEVGLRNATTVDLGLIVHGQHVVVAPGKVRNVPLTALGAIQFGAVYHAFPINAAAEVVCKPGAQVVLEARQDDALWISDGTQPEGFPLLPTEQGDLT